MIVETPMLSEDDRDYTSASEEETEAEPRKTKALGKPFPRIVRQSKGGWNRIRKGMSDEKMTGRIMLTQYISYEATDTANITLAYSLLISAKPPTPSTSKKLAPMNILLDTGASISLLPLW